MRIVEPGRIEPVELPTPRPGAGEVLVRVRCVGICGSDVHMFHGTHPFLKPPVVPGHEGSGVAEEVGAGVSRVRVGDRVTIDPTLSCGKCYPCRIGRYNCCTDIRVLGCYVDGLFAEYICLPERNVHKLPGGLSFEQGALAEPLTIGGQACARANVGPEDRVAVIGAGPIGLAVTAVARQRGARVLVFELKAKNREIALAMGAERAVDPAAEDMAQAATQWTGGEGPSVVVEAAGTLETIEAAVELVCAAGRVVILGLAQGKARLPAGMIIKKELDILGSRLAREQFPQVLALMASGELDPRPMITHRWPLKRAQEALEAQTDPAAGVVKSLVQVGD